MKKTTTLILALATMASVAQYNNTYDANANSDSYTPHFVITNKKAESITVAYGNDGATMPRTDYFILTKHDQSGNVIYNNRINPTYATTDGFTNVEALWQTDDDGVLVAGYHYDDKNFIEQPFLLKVDVNGNVQWLHIYYVNQKPMTNTEYNKISICRVYDDPKESYLIVATGDSDANPGVDMVTNVIRVDDQGNQIFSRKYYDQNPNPFNQLREFPGDIEFSPKDKMYMITGKRIEYSPAKNYNMYFFGIDNLGNVVTSYITLDSKSVPVDHDMVYDPNKNWFATTFTHSKSSYVTGYSSQMGFLSVDATMTVYNPEYIFTKEGVENNSRSISINSAGNYVIGSDILDNASTFDHNPAIVQVDPSGALLSNVLRYNILDNAYFGHHVTCLGCSSSGTDEHILVSEQKTDLRVIRTDLNGKACGVQKYKPYAKAYSPSITNYKYGPKDVGYEQDYPIYDKLYNIQYRSCASSTNGGDSYRPMAATGIEQHGIVENGIELYPSVMSADNARLTIANNSGKAVKVEVRSITGQLIAEHNQVTDGATTIQLNNNGSLAQGMYLVRVYDAAGTIGSTSKILIK